MFLGLLCCAFGCATGREKAAQLARDGGFAPLRLETGPFALQAWLKAGSGSVLLVYIEGDGLAYVRPNRPSLDPTPADPVGLRLALADPATGPVLSLARPCQYTEDHDRRGCTQAQWTSARFSEAAVAALDQAITEVKTITGTRTVALHGYSGGGAMAALLAERRGDVVFLATVAGNLDHRLFTQAHGDAPLSGSLNPADRALATRNIRQLHVAGGEDSVIPSSMLEAWCARLPGASVERVLVPGIGHQGPWDGIWPGLLRRHRDQ